MQNIIYDIVLKVHREEKILRMQSAAIIAEQAAEQAAAEARGQSDTPPENLDPSESPSTPLPDSVKGAVRKGLKVTTPGAIYDGGKVYLRGNPLATTKEILCRRCRLPRLLYPTDGIGARTPDPGKEYCAKRPYIDKPGHDVYGKPFPSHNAKAPKKRKKNSEAQRESTPAGLESNTSSPPEIITPGRPTTDTAGGAPFPNVDCPICEKSIVVTMVARHLEKCLGIGGRQSSRNAMARMNKQNGNGGTPLGSKRGTPAPEKRAREELNNDNDEDDEFGETPKKRKRKTATTKKRPAKTPNPASNSQNCNGATPLSSSSGSSAPGKMAREKLDDGDEDDCHPEETPKKKKSKRASPKSAVKKGPAKTLNAELLVA